MPCEVPAKALWDLRRGDLSKGPGMELGKLYLDGIAEAPQNVNLGLQMKEMRKQVQGHPSEVCGLLWLLLMHLTNIVWLHTCSVPCTTLGTQSSALHNRIQVLPSKISCHVIRYDDVMNTIRCRARSRAEWWQDRCGGDVLAVPHMLQEVQKPGKEQGKKQME